MTKEKLTNKFVKNVGENLIAKHKVWWTQGVVKCYRSTQMTASSVIIHVVLYG